MDEHMNYLSNEELLETLAEYNEQSFDQLPDWIQEEQIRQLNFGTRQPTSQETEESIEDGKWHRIASKERTMQDFKDKYQHKDKVNV
jgi:hypothetical protein